MVPAIARAASGHLPRPSHGVKRCHVRACLQATGRVTYNGHELHEFLPERTAVYVEQEDQHMPELTVRETFNFSARCQGAGSNAGALLPGPLLPLLCMLRC